MGGHSSWIFRAAVAAAALLCCAKALRITSQNRRIEGPRGQNRTLPCTVNGRGYNFFYNPIIWYKMLEDGSRVQMNNGAVMRKPFLQTDRYSISPRQEGKTVHMPLKIAGTTLAENGTYVCELQNQLTAVDNVTYHLIVTENAHDLALWSDSDMQMQVSGNGSRGRIRLTELRPAYVGCRVSNGYPLPGLRIVRTGADVTHDFKVLKKERVTGDVGLEVLRRELQLVQRHFVPQRHDDERLLECKVQQSRTMRQRVSAVMDVQYAPVFDCAKEVFAFANAPNFSLACTVHANPPIDKPTLRWTLGSDWSNGSTPWLAPHEHRSGYRVTVHKIGHNKKKQRVVLHIANVTEGHFQFYRVSVSNSVGGAQERLRLVEGKPKTMKNPFKSGSERSVEIRHRGKGPPYDVNSSAGRLHQLTTLILVMLMSFSIWR